MSVKINDGDFVVLWSRYGAHFVQAKRVTATRVYSPSAFPQGREIYHSKNEVVFSGKRSKAKNLAEKLQQSYIDEIDERDKARNRRANRDRELIDAADRGQL